MMYAVHEHISSSGSGFLSISSSFSSSFSKILERTSTASPSGAFRIVLSPLQVLYPAAISSALISVFRTGTSYVSGNFHCDFEKYVLRYRSYILPPSPVRSYLSSLRAASSKRRLQRTFSWPVLFHLSRPPGAARQTAEEAGRRFPYAVKPQEVYADGTGRRILALNLLEEGLEDGHCASLPPSGASSIFWTARSLISILFSCCILSIAGFLPDPPVFTVLSLYDLEQILKGNILEVIRKLLK